MAIPEGMKEVSGFELLVPDSFDGLTIEWLQKVGNRYGGLDFWPSVWVELCFLAGLEESLSYLNSILEDKTDEDKKWKAEFLDELKKEYKKYIDEGFEPGKPLPVESGETEFDDDGEPIETKPPPTQPGRPPKPKTKPKQKRSNKMAKSKSFLSGISKEYRSKITALRNEGRKAAAAEKEKDSEKYKDGLYKVRTAFIRAMEDAKKAGEIPKTTTIDKIGKLPKEVPSRWSATYKRIFGRKSPLGKPAAEKPAEKSKEKPAPKKKAPAKKKR